MKERGKPGVLDTTDRPSRSAYQWISLYIFVFFVFLLPGFFGFGRIWKQEFMLRINSCQGAIPLDPLKSKGGKAWRGHGWERRSGGDARWACG